ncbi:unnamed protein product [Calypogeia fissa]
MVMMDDIQTSLTGGLRSKKFQERVLSWSFWTVTAVSVTVGIAWVYSITSSMDPYFILSPGRPWLGLRDQNKDSLGEGFDNGTITSTQQQLNGTDEHEGLPEDHEVDDGYFIRQTGIRGKNAVDQFRARTACLSTSGRWVYDPKPRKIPWMAVKNYDWVRKCDRDHTHHKGLAEEMADAIALSNGSDGTWSVRDELKWVWQTDDRSCPWHPLDRDDFCRRLGSNRNVLVVGDSINHEISVAIQNALMMNKSSIFTEQKYAGEELCSDVLGGEGKGLEVLFVRNDYISPVRNSTSFGRTFQDPWLPHLDNGDGGVKILVLNRGAHYQDDRRFVEGLRLTFEVLRDKHPELLVIYRNTPSGHVNCTDFHAPIPEPIKGAPPSFHWEDFDRQNALAKEIVEEFQHIYLDVARPIGMRPEGHKHSKDCLHYCQPGPLDLAVEMIYNALLLLP